MKTKINIKKVLERLPEDQKGLVEQFLKGATRDIELCPLTRTNNQFECKEMGATEVEGYISTRLLDHSRDIVVPEGVILDVFKMNPIILYQHNSSGKPIAKAVEVSKDDFGVKAKIMFADTDEARDINKLVKGGFLNTFSIGFIPLAYMLEGETGFGLINNQLKMRYPEYNGGAERIITKWLLLEASIVTIPDNPTAVITQKTLKDLEIKEKTIEELQLPVELVELIEKAEVVIVEEPQKSIDKSITLIAKSKEKTIDRSIKVISEVKVDMDRSIKEAIATRKGIILRG